MLSQGSIIKNMINEKVEKTNPYNKSIVDPLIGNVLAFISLSINHATLQFCETILPSHQLLLLKLFINTAGDP